MPERSPGRVKKILLTAEKKDAGAMLAEMLAGKIVCWKIVCWKNQC
jgi:hypothetical protein